MNSKQLREAVQKDICLKIAKKLSKINFCSRYPAARLESVDDPEIGYLSKFTIKVTSVSRLMFGEITVRIKGILPFKGNQDFIIQVCYPDKTQLIENEVSVQANETNFLNLVSEKAGDEAVLCLIKFLDTLPV